MNAIVVASHPPAGERRKPGAAGINAEWLTMEVHEPDAADRRIQSDFVASIWCGAMVGCIGAAVVPPFPEGRP